MWRINVTQLLQVDAQIGSAILNVSGQVLLNSNAVVRMRWGYEP